MADWLESFDKFFGSPFTCEVCKNDKCYLTLECPCKESIHICLVCFLGDPDNGEKMWREFSAHARKCPDLGRQVAIFRYMKGGDNDNQR